MRVTYFWIIPLFLIGFIVVHLAKMMRLYLILMEQKIEFRRFVLTYLKTTFVNLVIPFKLGEIYRIFCFSRETKVFQIGLFSVIVDRFFDTVALLVLLIPFEVLITGEVTWVTGVLTIAAILAIFVFVVFPGIYTYLNRYIIMNKTSVRSMTALRGLEVTKTWYDYVRNLISGRYALIILLSCAAWIAETGVLWCLSTMRSMAFGASAFSEYIAAIFMSGKSPVLTDYIWISATIMGMLTVAGYVIYLVRHRGSQKQKKQK